MKKTFIVIAAVVCGLFTAGIATAGRSSGTYSLPATYNPVVSNTTITSAWANNTLNDIASALTDSLSRSGSGGMLAPLRGTDGTVAAPSFSFTNDTASGLYRIGTSDWGLSAGSTLVCEAKNTGITMPLGLTVTQSQTNTSGITVTGNGTAPAITANGGSGTGGRGIVATAGGTNAEGGVFTATGNQVGVRVTGGPTNGPGIISSGQGTGIGARFDNGTAATSTTRQTAVTLSNGDLDLSGVVNPASTTALLNRLTPKNIVKAWADISFNSTATPTVNDGANIASVSASSSQMTVTFAQAFANTNYSVVATPSMLSTTVCGPYVLNGKTTTTATFNVYQMTPGTPANMAAHNASGSSVCAAEVIAIGAQ